MAVYRKSEVIESLGKKHEVKIPNDHFIIIELKLSCFRNFYSGNDIFNELYNSILSEVSEELIKEMGCSVSWTTRNRIYLIWEPIPEQVSRIFGGKTSRLISNASSRACVLTIAKLMENLVDYKKFKGYETTLFSFYKPETLLHFVDSEFHRNLVRVKQDCNDSGVLVQNLSDDIRLGLCVKKTRNDLANGKFDYTHFNAKHLNNDLINKWAKKYEAASRI